MGFFLINTLDGKNCILAHISIKSVYRVGKYGVNIENLENIAVPSIIPNNADELILVDEIGKMECYSTLFRETVIKALDSNNPVIGTIALKGDKFISGLKSREDVLIEQITEQNRDELVKKYF